VAPSLVLDECKNLLLKRIDVITTCKNDWVALETARKKKALISISILNIIVTGHTFVLGINIMWILKKNMGKKKAKKLIYISNPPFQYFKL
jgi:hypothetical protein